MIDIENPLNLNSKNAKIAFSFRGYVDQELKDDPRYVKWFIRTNGKKNGKQFNTIHPHRLCTEEDYAEFYPIAAG